MCCHSTTTATTTTTTSFHVTSCSLTQPPLLLFCMDWLTLVSLSLTHKLLCMERCNGRQRHLQKKPLTFSSGARREGLSRWAKEESTFRLQTRLSVKFWVKFILIRALLKFEPVSFMFLVNVGVLLHYYTPLHSHHSQYFIYLCQ
jgi:hypothetical protein